jgi:hypothetical protein
MNDPLFRHRLREVWLDRLETCFYSQGYDRLASRDHGGDWHYCYFGAACEVYLELGGLLAVTETPDDRLYNGESLFLPEAVREAFGFRSVRGIKGLLTEEYDSLTSANDSEALTFPEIARLIRSHFDRVFLD